MKKVRATITFEVSEEALLADGTHTVESMRTELEQFKDAMVRDDPTPGLSVTLEVKVVDVPECLDYPWDVIPAVYDWCATDPNGDVFAYSSEPHRWAIGWGYPETSTAVPFNPHITSPHFGDWKHSLRKRP